MRSHRWTIRAVLQRARTAWSGRELARPPLRMPRDGPLHRPARVEGPQRGLPGRPISSGQVRRASGACSGDPEGATAGQAQPE